MSDNPYASPASRLSIADPSVKVYKLATRQQRALTFIFDLIFCYVLLIILQVMLFLLNLDFRLLTSNLAVSYLLDLFLYYLVQESVWGWTLAKLVFKTRVQSNQNTEADVFKIAARTALRFVPLEFVSYLVRTDKSKGYLQDRITGWHDRYSNTIVVDVRSI